MEAPNPIKLSANYDNGLFGAQHLQSCFVRYLVAY